MKKVSFRLNWNCKLCQYNCRCMFLTNILMRGYKKPKLLQFCTAKHNNVIKRKMFNWTRLLMWIKCKLFDYKRLFLFCIKMQKKKNTFEVRLRTITYCEEDVCFPKTTSFSWLKNYKKLYKLILTKLTQNLF